METRTIKELVRVTVYQLSDGEVLEEAIFPCGCAAQLFTSGVWDPLIYCSDHDLCGVCDHPRLSTSVTCECCVSHFE